MSRDGAREIQPAAVQLEDETTMNGNGDVNGSNVRADHDDIKSPVSPNIQMSSNPYSRKNTSMDLGDYFVSARCH